MLDTDPRLRDELEWLLPLPDVGESNWNEVVRRLGPPRRRRHGLSGVGLAFVAVTAVVLGVTPVGGAVVRGVGDFSAWLRGEPGKPASSDAQQEFASERLRSWLRFPGTPKLRLLIEHEGGETSYELYGFRNGGSLCLRLVARGSGSEPATSCAPLRDLREARAPALVLLADHPVGERELPADALPGEYVAPRASATFGIVADGVSELELIGDDGPHRPTIKSNAFLYVNPRPVVGDRLREASAVTADGKRRNVPFAAAPFGLTDVPATPPAGKPFGPARVELDVQGGSIGWLERREPRGLSPTEAGLTEAGLNAFPPGRWVRFARVLTPDSESDTRILVSFVDFEPGGPMSPTEAKNRLCIGIFSANRNGITGCGTPLDQLFRRGPVFAHQLGVGAGNQYTTFDGLVSDDVKRLEMFLATRERIAVPLQDNAFVIEVARTKFPARLVAYDDQDRVIWVETYASDPMSGGSGAHALAGKERVVLRVAGRDAEAVLRIAPSSDGGRCWRITYSSGSEGGGCPPKNHRGPLLDAALRPAGRDVFVEVEVREQVDVVVIEPAGGEAVRIRPTEGFAIHALATDAQELAVTVRALAPDGRELARRQVRIRR